MKRALALSAFLLAPLAARPEIPYAVDRSGQRPVPLMTARDHCAWPNLKLLKDGRTLATGSYDRTIRLWDVGSGKVIRNFQGHTEEIRSLAGRFLETARLTLASSTAFPQSVRLQEPCSFSKFCRCFSPHSVASESW